MFLPSELAGDTIPYIIYPCMQKDPNPIGNPACMKLFVNTTVYASWSILVKT